MKGASLFSGCFGFDCFDTKDIVDPIVVILPNKLIPIDHVTFYSGGTVGWDSTESGAMWSIPHNYKIRWRLGVLIALLLVCAMSRLPVTQTVMIRLARIRINVAVFCFS